jgi:hypothetical protein
MSLKYGRALRDFDVNQGCIADLDPACTQSARSSESPFALWGERVKATLPMASPIFFITTSPGKLSSILHSKTRIFMPCPVLSEHKRKFSSEFIWARRF